MSETEPEQTNQSLRSLTKEQKTQALRILVEDIIGAEGRDEASDVMKIGNLTEKIVMEMTEDDPDRDRIEELTDKLDHRFNKLLERYSGIEEINPNL